MGSRVVFALMFIAIMAVLNTSVLTLGTSANNQLNTTVSSGDVSLQIYDGTVVSGANVRDAAKKPDGIGSTSLYVEVHTLAGTSGTTATYTGSSPYNVTDKNDAKFINPGATFESELHYNSNGVVDGIVFQQK